MAAVSFGGVVYYSKSVQENGGGGTMRMGSLGLLLKGDMGAGRVTRLRGQVLN